MLKPPLVPADVRHGSPPPHQLFLRNGVVKSTSSLDFDITFASTKADVVNADADAALLWSRTNTMVRQMPASGKVTNKSGSPPLTAQCMNADHGRSWMEELDSPYHRCSGRADRARQGTVAALQIRRETYPRGEV
ncbi:hypothetical protein THAOC_20323 [Thalassiosira oceanica]|uniref:Uncharacterized protein n=1 Tax=Thalassiosira oceanica TaxID=159749 RepID=K0S3L6_THAOC|nr:hypothetical protein THAOC_20323 [Thalassiosira oceanica]|eukprot:EJK59454.1 hypothetical protein THAOC_20323 [Thalassiosira oceanica]